MAFYIENRIGVAAPASAVWAFLADIDRWGEWNPLYTQSSGKLRIGERITVELAIPGEKPETVHATVLDWAPDIQIHLRVKLYGGLLTTTRYMEIEAMGEAACIFGNGEVFRGPLARFMPRRLRAGIRQGFLAMSEALKAKAEAAFRAERDGEPIGETT